jgi:hypothetical protein
VDRIEKADAAGIVGYKTFRPDEFFFAGHSGQAMRCGWRSTTCGSAPAR